MKSLICGILYRGELIFSKTEGKISFAELKVTL